MKEKTEPLTRVIFRVWRNGSDAIALFPDLTDGPYCTSYQHVGQHGNAAYDTVVLLTRPAKPEEFASLKRELEQIGYRLSVVARRGRKRNA